MVKVKNQQNLIECKNRNWTVELQNQKKFNDFCSKLSEQAKIAKEKNKVFELHSKHQIPLKIKEWLIKKEIYFFEESI